MSWFTKLLRRESPLEQPAKAPGPLEMRFGTRVVVRMRDGTQRKGEFRDAAPDGSYAIRLDGENGRLYAFDEVRLENAFERKEKVASARQANAT
jgi:hypothetical protein